MLEDSVSVFKRYANFMTYMPPIPSNDFLYGIYDDVQIVKTEFLEKIDKKDLLGGRNRKKKKSRKELDKEMNQKIIENMKWWELQKHERR